MGAQYSTGTTSPDWKAWLEERCSLETLRSFYQDFRVSVSYSKRDNIDSDDFFITAEEFRLVSWLCRRAIGRAVGLIYISCAPAAWAINAARSGRAAHSQTFFLLLLGGDIEISLG